jgi:hypothetical protein
VVLMLLLNGEHDRDNDGTVLNGLDEDCARPPCLLRVLSTGIGSAVQYVGREPIFLWNYYTYLPLPPQIDYLALS